MTVALLFLLGQSKEEKFQCHTRLREQRWVCANLFAFWWGALYVAALVEPGDPRLPLLLLAGDNLEVERQGYLPKWRLFGVMFIESNWRSTGLRVRRPVFLDLALLTTCPCPCESHVSLHHLPHSQREGASLGQWVTTCSQPQNAVFKWHSPCKLKTEQIGFTARKNIPA